MRREAWSISARLAWHRPRFRAFTLLLLVGVTLVNLFFLVKTVPVVREATTAAIHYNVYLGIDDVRDWVWIFLWPAIWEATIFVGLGVALGVYQKDTLLSYGVLGWLWLWSAPWFIGLMYLLQFNTR